MIKNDVAIIGAGVAGLTAARTVAESGLSVVVLESQPLPPSKPCAGGLTQKARALLPDNAQSSIRQSLLHSVYRPPLGPQYRFACEEPHVHCVDRADLAQKLWVAACKAGARILPLSMVTDIRRSRVSWRIQTDGSATVQAHLIIGSFGAQRPTANGFLPRGYSDLRASVAGFIRSDRMANLHEDWETVDCMLTRDGVLCFAFPMFRGYNVGAMSLRSSSRARMPFARLVATAHEYSEIVLGIGTNGTFKPGWLPLGVKWKSTSGDGFLLAGDAAGLCDPLFGEGIYFALRSGEIAAQSAVDALAIGEMSLRGYSRRIQQEFSAAFCWQRLTAAVVGRWPAMVTPMLTSCPDALETMVDYMDDFSKWRDFRRLPSKIIGKRLHNRFAPHQTAQSSVRVSLRVIE